MHNLPMRCCIVLTMVAPAHGADVLLVTSPKLPALPFLDMDTSRGKRTTKLDLTDPTDRDILAGLAKDADVFLQGYRPGGLRDKGFGVQDVAKLRPGIVYASLTAYGWNGPWKDRRGVRLHFRVEFTGHLVFSCSLIPCAVRLARPDGDGLRSCRG